MSYVNEEIASQPQCWAQAADLAVKQIEALPAAGERVAVVGCGTSWFMAQSYAELREAGGHGETDAFAASQMPRSRRYDRIVAITRSGTTSEVCELLRELDTPSTAIVGEGGTPATELATHSVVMPFADEKSVVQTRYATSALALLRAHLGEDLTAAIADASTALAADLPVDIAPLEQVTFLGDGWTVGLAHEAGLKMREAATFWTESYPAMEYRHGPISITGPNRATWMFGAAPQGLADDVTRTGGRFVTSTLDPMADLVLAQRLAVAMAEHRGLDPDQPRHLSRSVILK
ncbi:fructoselysine-6-P-deglycase FrlB-like protein [Stackebrandtia endophytica]|uniref:Fructoselysine-6-P-deglycase FrlB-like protein n=1 Tax=Stackebrandtia endophytica TaxID=1496996 RepID=A0A543AWR7_9ACTN|nr:sugar isomerase [Stackebrandtia endophytica]TQL77004.1 fructoselysine-6-P-deglycase FrlB-like protein [Stackebrandtia endophytica]